MKPQRTVTHLTSFSEGDTSNAHVIAACDDGTVWRFVMAKGSPKSWIQMPSIPGTQPEAAE